jgi:hypothetical protein
MVVVIGYYFWNAECYHDELCNVFQSLQPTLETEKTYIIRETDIPIIFGVACFLNYQKKSNYRKRTENLPPSIAVTGTFLCFMPACMPELCS